MDTPPTVLCYITISVLVKDGKSSENNVPESSYEWGKAFL